MVSEGNDNTTDVAQAAAVTMSLLLLAPLFTPPSSFLFFSDFSVCSSVPPFQNENGEWAADRRDERMCSVSPSLSPFRPTLALLFNFPQDNNPMTTLTITENERGGRGPTEDVWLLGRERRRG